MLVTRTVKCSSLVSSNRIMSEIFKCLIIKLKFMPKVRNLFCNLHLSYPCMNVVFEFFFFVEKLNKSKEKSKIIFVKIRDSLS